MIVNKARIQTPSYERCSSAMLPMDSMSDLTDLQTGSRQTGVWWQGGGAVQLLETSIRGVFRVRSLKGGAESLVKPGAKKILFAALPPLAWPHRKSPAPSARARRITAFDSRESSKSNLQGSRPPKAKNRQIRLLERAQSSSPFNGF